MTLFLSNRDGNGKTSEEGHYKFPLNAFTGNVLAPTDLAVTQQTVPALGVTVAAGQYRIPDVSGAYAYSGWNDTATNVTVTTADPANPRLSAIVIYVDKGAATSASPPNNPGICKFMSVNGTAAAVPVAPNGATIQAAVGAGNPYIVLAHARVNAAGTTITNALITDVRTFVKLGANLIPTASVEDLAITTGKIADLAVTTGKIANLGVTTGKIAANAVTAAKMEVQEAWISPALQNGWVRYDLTYHAPGYYKDSLGFVHLRGMIKSGIAANMFILPAGYRPQDRMLVASFSANGATRIDIANTGQVLGSTGYSASWTTLDNISFRAHN